MKILFVINPVSGGNNKDEFNELVKEFASTNGFEFQFFNTSGENDEQNLKKTITHYKPDQIIAAGGDGTIQLVARSILQSKATMPMGILPLGSANGLATSLGITQKESQALDTLFNKSTVQPMDLLKVNDKHICIHLGDIGTNALLVKNYSETEDRGMMGYAKHLISSIQESPLLHYSIITPTERYEKEGYLLAFANAHKYGTGVHISDGSVSDGFFEICNVQKLNLEAAIKAGLTILNVFVDKDMFSDIVQCKKAEIHIQPKAHLQIDGEYMGETDYVKIEILESAIQVLIPNES